MTGLVVQKIKFSSAWVAIAALVLEACTPDLNHRLPIPVKIENDLTSISTTTATGYYKAGNTINIVLSFSKTMIVTGTPQITLNTTPPSFANFVSGSGTSTLLFRYIVGASDNSSRLDSASATLNLNGGTINSDTSDAVFTLPTNGSSDLYATNVVVDNTPPTIAITSPVNNGYINIASDSTSYTVSGTCSEANQTVTIKADGASVGTATCTGSTFSSSNVNSTLLSTGAPHNFTASISDLAGNSTTSAGVSVTREITAPAAATLLSWTTTSPSSVAGVTATWTKSASGELANQKIQYYADGTCTTPSGSLIDLASAASQSNAFTGTTGTTYTYKITSLDTALNPTVSACSSSMAIDTVAPTITSVSSTTAAGYYPATTVVNVTVNFSEVVNVNTSGGTPTITLNTTPTARTASYFSGSGSTALVFHYTVLATDTSAHLDYSATTALSLNGATIRDAASNNATLTLPTPASASDLLYTNQTIVIDTTSPTIAITSPVAGAYINIASNSTSYTVSGTCSEANQTVTIKADGASVGTATCTGSTFSSSNVNTTGLSDGAHNFTASILDQAGNSTTSATVSVTRDVLAPAAATGLGWSTASPSSATGVTATWTKSASGDLANQKIQYYADGTCTTPSGSLIDLASAASQSNAFTGTTGTTYTYKITSLDTALNPTVSACSSSMMIDTVAPTITTVSSTTAAGYYPATTLVNVTVNFSKIVNVLGGTPTITLNTSPARSASYASGTGSTALVFTYTVLAGDTASHLDYSATTALSLNGATIRDAASNSATLTLPTPASASDLLYSNQTIVIDTTPPSVTLTALTGGNVIQGSMPQHVGWTATDTNMPATDAIEIFYSTDSGATWTSIATSLNLSTYDWGVPAINSTTARIKITATDKAGNVGSASSTSDFTIVNNSTFNGWNNVQALGAKTPVTQSGLASANASITLNFNAMTSGATISSYNIYRATTSGGQNFFAPLATGITTAALSYTDTSSLVAGITYYYVVRPVISGMVIAASAANDLEIAVPVPPANMALLHRWMVNLEACGTMGRTPDRANNYRCNYTGPAGTGTYYDFNGGVNLFVDTYGVGCNYTPTNGACGNTYGCLGSSGAPTGGTGVVGNVYYDRSTGDCYLKTAAATWTSANTAGFTSAQVALVSSNAPGLPPLVKIDQVKSSNVCTQQTVTGYSVTKRLLRHSEQIAAAAWPATFSDATITAYQNGSNLPTTGYCNSNSGNGLTYDNLNPPANLETLSGTLASGIKSVITGSTSTKNCVSRYGIQDLVGNVWTWNSDQLNTCSSATHTCQGMTSQLDTANHDWNGFNFDGTIGPGGGGSTTEWDFSAGSYSSTQFQTVLGLPMVAAASSAWDFLTVGNGTGQFDSAKFHGDHFWLYTDSANGTPARGSIAGGSWSSGAKSGRFAVFMSNTPASAPIAIGLRCALPVQ